MNKVIFLVLTAMQALVAGPASAQGQPPPKPDLTMLPYADTSQSVRLADGRAIHLVCMGKGSPTVILTSGLGDWGVTWSKVQPAVANKTRVCAWDRAGAGFSDASAAPQGVDNTAADLAVALRRGRIKGPYLLVGHSLGGYESLLFADRNRKQVRGMVLVDPSFPGQAAELARLPAYNAAAEKNRVEQIAVLHRCATNVRSGAVKLGAPDPDHCLEYPSDYPPVLSAKLARRDYDDPARFDTQASLLTNVPRDSRIVTRRGRSYGNMPLVVLTATAERKFPQGTPDAVKNDASAFRLRWQRSHDAIAALSTRGVNRLVPGASHYIHQIKPQVVIDAINEVIDQARSGSSASPAEAKSSFSRQ